ncbi:MAG: SHOCT domain-containing protein [Euryarchaeota archaeon]|nr:SHOCT domain-containing protein [Euryarchaeota archaeon]
MMAFGWLWMLLPIALMVAIMYGMMSMGHGHHGAAHAQGRPDDARAILDRRYAAGEISRDDYARIRDDLDPPRRP